MLLLYAENKPFQLFKELKKVGSSFQKGIKENYIFYKNRT